MIFNDQSDSRAFVHREDRINTQSFASLILLRWLIQDDIPDKTGNILPAPNLIFIRISGFCFWISFVPGKLYLVREIWRAAHHGSPFLVLHHSSEHRPVFFDLPFSRKLPLTIPIPSISADRQVDPFRDLHSSVLLQGVLDKCFWKAAYFGILINVRVYLWGIVFEFLGCFDLLSGKIFFAPESYHLTRDWSCSSKANKIAGSGEVFLRPQFNPPCKGGKMSGQNSYYQYVRKTMQFFSASISFFPAAPICDWFDWLAPPIFSERRITQIRSHSSFSAPLKCL